MEIGFGHLRGIARAHGYVGDIPQVINKAVSPVGEAHLLCAQVLKCLHQVALDNGEWQHATLYVSTPDLYAQRRHGGSERDGEIIAQYLRSAAD